MSLRTPVGPDTPPSDAPPAAPATPIRVAIVEDSPGMLRNLSRLFNESPGFECAGAYAAAETALETLPRENPDVVLMDINLPGMDGVECVRRLKAQMPGTMFVMHTVYEDMDRIFKAIQAGASGYLLKRTDPLALLQSIREARQGGAPMTSIIARKVLDAFRKQIPAPATRPKDASLELSAREEEVLEKLAKGFLLKEIADQLGVGYATVRTYTERIYQKLHVHSRSEAAARYFQTHQ
jgi:DNA-binding NarL/FixJ family response regulator